jgi:hypothetical protein
LVGSAARVWAEADLILKVKEPLPAEYSRLREGQMLFTYLHLAAGPELAKVLLKKKILGISYETVEANDGSFPLLKPMSQIAGRLAIQVGAYFLQSQHGGSGVLLGGIPGTLPGHVVVVGAGNSGAHAVVEGVGDHGCEYMTGGRVVILGPTGRNFAAGMSGGIAYVYDPQGRLGQNLNTEMVNLEQLDETDLQWLRDMLVAHRDATDSAVAERILADWPRQAGDFVKVMPRDYKNVLAAIAEAERIGADVDEAIMAASRG